MHLFLVGAGHVGLVTAVGMSRLGHAVTVADIDATRIDMLRDGRAPIFEPGLEDAIRDAGERLRFTTDVRPPADVRFSFVAVGTPLGPEGPLALDHVRTVVRSLLDGTGADHTIVIRSTLPMSGPPAIRSLRDDRPGTASIVTNPEFMREGSALRDFDRPDRIVVGWIEERDRPAAERLLELYAGIHAPTLVADASSVALIKLASNVFLAMKVAYSNELARLCDAFGADAPTVADGLGMDARIGRAFLDAGPGYGGSCLPEQAEALSAIAGGAGVPAPLIDAVANSNVTHQRALATRLATLLGRSPAVGGRPDLADTTIAQLGLAFKANTDDVRRSPALAIAAELRAAGATVAATDPRAAANATRSDPDLVIADSPVAAATGADAVLVVTEWAEYRTLDWREMAGVMRGDLVYDTRAVVDAAAVAAAGLRLERLGRR